MLFNSYLFLFFFACVLLLHQAPLGWRFKKANLLVASYLFYAAWNPPFVLLLWFSTGVDWFCAHGIHCEPRLARRRAYLGLSLAANLGPLALFKYGRFLQANLAAVGLFPGLPALDLVLPVGISFYTFQSLSYTLDVYRGATRPWDSLLDFALYVGFFPQLVAGPIVRSGDFLPQCRSARQPGRRQLGWGLSLIVLGLFEKTVVADGLLAPVVEKVFSPRAGAVPATVAAWCGTLAFSGQIFCDFAGYSTCALGVAMCLGFRLPDNFRFPYAARGFKDFWRRWHITLSTWLRDYLYISLGGNRRRPARVRVNLMLTMLLGGLWHGASWTFVVWGGLHGLFLLVERALVASRLGRWSVWRGRWGKAAIAAGTFAAVSLAWAFFRADSFQTAFGIAGAMIGFAPRGPALQLGMQDALFALGPVLGILFFHHRLRDTTLEEAAARVPAWLVSLLLAAMILAIVTMHEESRAFLYFQF